MTATGDPKLTRALRAAGLLLSIATSLAQAQSSGDTSRHHRREYPLYCRGGGGLAFDTIGPSTDTGGKVGISLTFAAGAIASGPEGQGLAPGTCAWLDRPVNPSEPRRIHVTIGIGDSTPAQTVADTGVYWSFLAHNSDSGHMTGVGYRHWHASSPPFPRADPSPAAAPQARGIRLPFDVRYLPLIAVGWVVIAWAPMLLITGRWSGWRRLAGLYPNRNTGKGRSFRCSPVVMGMTNYRGGVRLTPDESHLHFAMSPFLRPGHRPFSVTWSDIEASRAEWPWFPLRGHPVIRLTLAKHRDLRILVPLRDGERLLAARGGRLELNEPRTLAAAAQQLHR